MGRGPPRRALQAPIGKNSRYRHKRQKTKKKMTNTPEWKQALDRPRLKSLLDLFPSPKPVIGMIHLWPLPGAPGYNGYGVQKIVDNAEREAESLIHGGVDGLMVEN